MQQSSEPDRISMTLRYLGDIDLPSLRQVVPRRPRTNFHTLATLCWPTANINPVGDIDKSESGVWTSRFIPSQQAFQGHLSIGVARFKQRHRMHAQEGEPSRTTVADVVISIAR